MAVPLTEKPWILPVGQASRLSSLLGNLGLFRRLLRVPDDFYLDLKGLFRSFHFLQDVAFNA